MKFAYEPRLDWGSGYFVGGRYGHSDRIAHINVEGPDGELLFTYGLDYEGDEADANFLTKRSRLTSVTKCDRFGQCLPPTVIEWIVGEGEDFVSWRSAFAYPNDDGEADPDSAGSVAMRDAQVLLTQASHRLVGDFNGDLAQEELFWTFDGPGSSASIVHIWDEAGEPLLPYTTVPVQQFQRIPGSAEILDGVSNPEPEMHRIGASLEYAIGNYTARGRSPSRRRVATRDPVGRLCRRDARESSARAVSGGR